MKKLFLITSVIAISCVVQVSVAMAQSTTTQGTLPLTDTPNSAYPPLTDETVLPVGTVNCFDYYHFGSVQTDIMSRSSNAVPGMTMQFSGTITNANDYPVVGGTLYVKIFKDKSKDKGPEKDVNGPDVVDEFVAMGNITIAAKSSVKASFPWKVPLYARAGNYRIASFFATDKKFNLLGLSFTDDVIGNTFDFTIESKQSNIYFDKSSVVINSQPYFFGAFPPRIEDKDSAAISAKITNSTGKDEIATTTWNLYHWDSMSPDNLIRTVSTTTFVKAHSSAVVNITVPDKEFPVYLLIGELAYKDSKSILNIRYVRGGVDRVRLNFPSILQFPLEKGVTSTMFTCLHNSGSSALVPDGKLVLELKDEKGVIVDTYTYEGGITGEMMAVKKDFVLSRTLDNVTLHAVLYESGKVVDESTIVYNCNSIDPTKCNKTATASGAIPFALPGAIILVVVLAGLGVGYGIYKKKMSPKLLIFVLLFIPLSFYFTLQVTEAKSVVSTLSSPENLWGHQSGTSFRTLLRNRTVQISYNVFIYNENTGAFLSDNDSVPVNSTLLFKFIPHWYADISWVGTGFGYDSPWGDWRIGATALPVSQSCQGTYNITISGGPVAYVPLVVAPPTAKTITNTTGMTCGALTGDEANGFTQQCKVTADSGPLNPSFNFNATMGKFYFRSAYSGSCHGDGNYGDNSSMVTDRNLPYTLTVPAQTITYNLTATDVPTGNRPPTAPIISGPTVGQTAQQYTFGVVSTDPDNDQIKYGIDWSEPSDGVVDQWLPDLPAPNDFVNSGVSKDVTKSWATVGPHSFQAIAYDSHNANSTWTLHSIDLTVLPPPPPPPVTITGTCTANGGTSPISLPVGGGTVLFGVTNRTGGNGSYSNYWNNALVPSDTISLPFFSTPATASFVKIKDSTGAGSSNLSCPSISVSQPVSDLELYIGSRVETINAAIPTANPPKSLDVHRNEAFALKWVNGLSSNYVCDTIITKDGSTFNTLWKSTWDSDTISQLTSQTLNSSNADTGPYIFTISCNDPSGVGIDKASSAILNVISSTEVEH